MIKIGFFTIKPDKIAEFEAWMKALSRRREEVFETFRGEGTRHEFAAIIEGTDPPVVAYAMEVEDIGKSSEAFRQSRLPIDLEHKAVMNDWIRWRCGAASSSSHQSTLA